MRNQARNRINSIYSDILLPPFFISRVNYPGSSQSYNKKTGVHYAYETSYEWDEELQRKVQHRHCIGQFDPETGEIVPNKKVGRPGVKAHPKAIKQAVTGTSSSATINKKQLAGRLKKVETRLSALSDEITVLNNELAAIRADLNG